MRKQRKKRSSYVSKGKKKGNRKKLVKQFVGYCKRQVLGAKFPLLRAST